MSRVDLSTCCTCGTQWPTGTDGSHSCTAAMRATIARRTAELAANAAELVRVRAERDAAVANMDYQRLWQSLKDECCSNPKTACRIVLINREDYVKAWLRAAVPGAG